MPFKYPKGKPWDTGNRLVDTLLNNVAPRTLEESVMGMGPAPIGMIAKESEEPLVRALMEYYKPIYDAVDRMARKITFYTAKPGTPMDSLMWNTLGRHFPYARPEVGGKIGDIVVHPNVAKGLTTQGTPFGNLPIFPPGYNIGETLSHEATHALSRGQGISEIQKILWREKLLPHMNRSYAWDVSSPEEALAYAVQQGIRRAKGMTDATSQFSPNPHSDELLRLLQEMVFPKLGIK